MAEKAAPAPAERSATSDAPLKALGVVSTDRDGVGYPSVRIKGDPPRKGTTLNVTLENGVTYSGRVFGHEEADGATLVHFEGLEPVRDEAAE
jgi:hypothetical protein